MNLFKLLDDKSGFTLIELVAVIAILGIIASIAIPRVVGIREKAILQADTSNRDILTNAANLAIAENGNPKTSILWKDTKETDKGEFASSNYLDKWPKNPAGEEYILEISTDGSITIKPLIVSE